MFDSPWKRRKERQRVFKHKGRLKEPPPDHDKDMPIFDYGSAGAGMSRVYTWGMACYGALGVPEYLRPKSGKRKDFKPLTTMHRPARCGAAETRGVTDVACGYGFTVFAVRGSSSSNSSNNSNSSNGGFHIMGTGMNKSGQLGYIAPRRGHPLEMLVRPVGVALPTRSRKAKVVKVAAGREHTLALADDGDLFSLGNNAFGQCGRAVVEHEDYFACRSAHRVRGPWEEGDRIEDIHCGQDHSLVRTSGGRVYSFGWGADGQTGLGHYEQTGEPTLVAGDIEGENITKVATSADCVLAINDKGELFGWGNSEYSQFLSVTEEQQLARPTSLSPLVRGLGRIVDVACGGTVCLVLNEHHDVFVWGYGILGKGPSLEHSRTPTQIPNTLFGRNDFSPGTRVRSVHAGVHANAAVTDAGELYMWGKNKGSCLGLGDHKDQFFPLRVSLLNEVTKVSLGIDHTAALCKPWL